MSTDDIAITHQEMEALPDTQFQVVKNLEDEERGALKIVDGEFQNLVFSFRDIVVNEDEFDENDPTISFDFDILTFPDIVDFAETYEKNDELKRRVQTTVSKIFFQIIMEQVEKAEQERESKGTLIEEQA